MNYQSSCSGRYWVHISLAGQPLGRSTNPSATVGTSASSFNTSLSNATSPSTEPGLSRPGFELGPASSASPFNIFVSSGAPEVAGAQLLGVMHAGTLAGHAAVYLLRMHDLWGNPLTQQENITFRAHAHLRSVNRSEFWLEISGHGSRSAPTVDGPLASGEELQGGGGSNRSERDYRRDGHAESESVGVRAELRWIPEYISCVFLCVCVCMFFGFLDSGSRYLA